MDRLEQVKRARARARGVRVVKLTGQYRYLATSRTHELGTYFELRVSAWGYVCSRRLVFTHRARASTRRIRH